ncbi:MAG: hypothetical protein U5K00_17305 [Melioribacteraceae bacterium]|nr:hypothetical protein [Melioribacteraceae bacterium]
MIMIKRLLENRIKKDLFHGKPLSYMVQDKLVKLLSKSLLNNFGEQGRYLNCEIPSVERNLSNAEPDALKSFLEDYKVLVLDSMKRRIFPA